MLDLKDYFVQKVTNYAVSKVNNGCKGNQI